MTLAAPICQASAPRCLHRCMGTHHAALKMPPGGENGTCPPGWTASPVICLSGSQKQGCPSCFLCSRPQRCVPRLALLPLTCTKAQLCSHYLVHFLRATHADKGEEVYTSSGNKVPRGTRLPHSSCSEALPKPSPSPCSWGEGHVPVWGNNLATLVMTSLQWEMDVSTEAVSVGPNGSAVALARPPALGHGEGQGQTMALTER